MQDFKEIYNSLELNIKQKISRIKLICLDFDGVLTDNRVVHAQNEIEAVVRSKTDTFGLDLLRDAKLYRDDFSGEIDIVIISREKNPVVAAVAKKIKVRCIQSQWDKFNAFKDEILRKGLRLDQVMFVGNDLNDVECIQYCVAGGGLGVAVADSYPYVANVANYVTKSKGGNGALREICELILYARGLHPLEQK